MNEFTRVTVHRNPMVDGMDLYITNRIPGEQPGSFRVVTNMMFETIEEAVAFPKAPLWITMDNAKKLMDDLWNAGIRPTEMSETEGALAATKEHLKDMRDIAFRSIDDHYILNVQDKIIDE